MDTAELIIVTEKDGLKPDVKYKVAQVSVKRCGFPVYMRDKLCELVLADEADTKKIIIKANKSGTIKTIHIKKDDSISIGSAIISVAVCPHATLLSNTCGDCGLTIEPDSDTEEGAPPIVPSDAVSMLHTMPALKVSKKEAERLGEIDKQHLLKQRKLVLLVDLDQTIIHTTNDRVPDLTDVHQFKLHPRGPTYTTRLRPHATQFLRNMHRLYELHICTFGIKSYAHAITKILDPSGVLFGERILSRDECLDPNSKEANLNSLFPCGADMVCIVDDRTDVWRHVANVVQVLPYHFFRHTGDINAPPGLGKTERDGKAGGAGFTAGDKLNSGLKFKPAGRWHAGEESKPGSVTESVQGGNAKSKTGSAEDSLERGDSGSKSGLDTLREGEVIAMSESDPDGMKGDDQKSKSSPDTPIKDEADSNLDSAAEVRNKTYSSSSEEEKDDNIEDITEITKNNNETEVSSANVLSTDKQSVHENSSVLAEVVKTEILNEETDGIVKTSSVTDEESKSDEIALSKERKSYGKSQEELKTEKESVCETTEGDEKEDTINAEDKTDVTKMETSAKKIESEEKNNRKAEVKSKDGRSKRTPPKNEGEVKDSDDYLHYLEDILTRIHTRFYDIYEKKGEILPLRKLVPRLRAEVLRGCSVVFSGVVPRGAELQSSSAYNIAASLGASVQSDISAGRTHLVSASLDTHKMVEARKEHGVKIVTPSWLWCCAERWERVDERLFVLSKHTVGGVMRDPPAHCVTLADPAVLQGDAAIDMLLANNNMEKAKAEMLGEVDEELSEEDEESPKKRGLSEDDDSMQSGEFKRWKSGSSASDSDESLGELESGDEARLEAMEQDMEWN